MSPLFVLGGIYGGVFTPTEAAAMSGVYALVVGVFIGRQIGIRGIPEIVLKSIRTSAMVTAIIPLSAGFIAIMVILGPMLIAIATKFNVDPIHFAAKIVANVAVGIAAPPIGYCLFVALFLTTYIPQFALLLQPK